MIKAIIFDLNGVFIVSPKLSARFEKDFKIPVSQFLPKLGEIMDKVRRPNAEPAFTYWKSVLFEWKVDLSEKEFWDYWFKAEKPNAEMIVLAEELRKRGLKVITLSNNFKERAEYYGHYPWLKDSIDKVYFSWQTGLVKPDVRAWERVLSENALLPGECLYFDDQEKNLKSARSLGIKSFMFTTVEEVRKIIGEYANDKTRL